MTDSRGVFGKLNPAPNLSTASATLGKQAWLLKM
jgi:hypothetical protein